MSAGYTNLRVVNYRDTIAELIDRANQTHTRATGVQVFSPGDGMAYEDSEGFINPISPALFDDARDQIAEASESLVATEAELEAAKLRIEDTSRILDELDTQAQGTAEEMRVISENLDADMKRLEETQGELDLLKPRLGNVETAISDSAENLSKALSDSASAAEKAESAKNAMESLQAKLDAALNASPGLIGDSSFENPEAWQPAFGSSVKADSRASSGGNVWYSPPASVTGQGTSLVYSRSASARVVKGHVYRVTVRVMVEAAPSNDSVRLIYRGGDPLTYKGVSGSMSLSSQDLTVGKWALIQWDWEAPETETLSIGLQKNTHTVGTLIDDFQVVDATEQADLRLQIEDARREAVEAATAAQSAAEKAGEALTASSGKATVLNKTTTPQGVGVAVGDIWFQWTTFPGGVVTGQWSWSGTAWVPVTLSHQVISSLDLGKATVGELDGLRIKAGSVDASRMTIGVGANALADPFFTDSALRERRSAASTGAWSYGSDNGRPYMALTTAVTGTQTFRYAPLGTAGMIPTVAGRQWRIEVPMYLPSGRARVNVRWYNAQGAAFSYAAAGDYVTGPGEVRVVGEATAPSDAVGFLIDVYLPTETTARTAKVYGGASATVKSGSVHIEDGAVTASKVNAESVAGVIGSFINVKAENVEVTNELAARVFSATTATVAEQFVKDRLVVGTGGNQTVLEVLGAAVVNDLNIRGTLRGRNAILKGTLDVEQLNVTKDMAAQIVSAMEVETKKLIVTEAAVMQHVTAIEGIITPKITASEAKMGNLIAQKASIADIEAGNLTLTGVFRSGAAGKPGVIIPQNYTTERGFQQLGIWLAPTGVAPSLGSEWGSTAGIWLDEAANVAGTNARSALRIRGQSGAGVDAYGKLTVHKVPYSNSAMIESAAGENMQLQAPVGQHVWVWAQGGGAAQLLATGGGEAIVRSNGTGAAKIESTNGQAIVRSNTSDAFLVALEGHAVVEGKTSARLRTNGNLQLENMNGTAYDRVWTGGGLLSLYMGQSSGAVYRQASSARYKTDIIDMEPDHEWLDLRTVWYRDKAAVECAEAVAARQAAGDTTPITAQEYEMIDAAKRLSPGRIAEEAHTGGAAAQVAYGLDGTPEGYNYERDGTMLIPHVREHRDKIAALEARIAELESALL